MISSIKEMILRCMERMRGGACANCKNRAFCPAARLQQGLGAPRRQVSTRAATGFFAFLGELAEAVERTGRPRPEGFRSNVERAIEPLLSTGEVTAERVAGSLGISRQTLYRRLKAEGATFEELLDTKRHDLALTYLRRERMSVKAAAYRLGFSDPAAFSRAFKRWTGLSPSLFRNPAINS